jgi:hypothetical protein
MSTALQSADLPRPILDFDRLEALDAGAFQARDPYPWLNEAGLLSESGYRALVEQLPAVERFERSFGVARKHGQRPHDRHVLEWHEGLELAPAWQAFVDELRGDRYRRWLARMIGTRHFNLHFHWHYAPSGGEVSPHCDSKLKLGSHIFYMNTHDDWREEWGGETLVLDDGGRFEKETAPEFEDFDASWTARTLENYSLLFRRRGDSWHGVRAVDCPEGHYRRVFIVVIDDDSPWRQLKRWVKGKERRGV